LACACLPLIAAAPTAAAPSFENSGFDDQLVATGFDQPTAFAYTPDGRMFVTEKAGRVRVVPAGAHAPLSTPVIDISGHVNSSTDRGLLGIAVDAFTWSEMSITAPACAELCPGRTTFTTPPFWATNVRPSGV